MELCKAAGGAAFFLAAALLAVVGLYLGQWPSAIGGALSMAATGVLFLALDHGLDLLRQILTELRRSRPSN